MKMTNNEKILHIIDNYEEVIPYLQAYLKQLKECYEYANNQRANYIELVSSLNEFKRTLAKRLQEQKYVESLFKMAIKEAQNILDQNDNEVIEALLETLKNQSFEEEQFSQVVKILGANNPLSYLLKEIQTENVQTIPEESYRNAKEYIIYYTQSYREYQKMDKADIVKNVKSLISWGEEAGLEISGLEVALWLIEDDLRTEPIKPDPSELLDMLSKIRNPIAYISRGHTILNLYRPYISAMDHLRRVLRNRSGYLSVSRAIMRYYKAVRDIHEYYHNSYIQGGGTPKDTKETERNINRKQGKDRRGSLTLP